MILTGDCRDILATMDAESVDAVVTDPPYELTAGKKGGSGERSLNLAHPAGRSRITTGGGFMGKQWDGTGVAFDPETWRAVYRVMKPGARLLAFGGTRTHHRMVCAIEDAGFVIEDTICWLYGSGFPKHKSKLKPAHEPICVAWKPDTRATPLNIDQCRILPTSGPTAIIPAWEREQHLCDLCAEDAGKRPRLGVPAIAESTAIRSAEQTTNGRAETSPGDTSKMAIGCSDGPSRAGRSGDPSADTSLNTAESGKTPTVPFQTDTSSITSTKSRPTTASTTCASCGAAITPRCITETLSNTPSHPPGQTTRGDGKSDTPNTRPPTPNGCESGAPKGRYPSNVIFSHIAPDEHGNGGCTEVGTKRVKGTGPRAAGGKRGSPTVYAQDAYSQTYERIEHDGYADPDGMETVAAWDCARDETGAYLCPVAMLDAQSGKRTSGKPSANGHRRNATLHDTEAGWHMRHREDAGTLYGDTGGASRFFATFPPDDEATRFLYCPKASRAEREMGLDGLPLRPAGAMEGTHDGSLLTGAGNPRNNLCRNTHPTVKPLALMRWLVRLVTPPGGTVLDPFLGSGTTLMACELEGFSGIGIEQDESYAEIARRRLANVAPRQLAMVAD